MLRTCIFFLSSRSLAYAFFSTRLVFLFILQISASIFFPLLSFLVFFFLNDPPPPEISPFPLPAPLPINPRQSEEPIGHGGEEADQQRAERGEHGDHTALPQVLERGAATPAEQGGDGHPGEQAGERSEEHTSELQSQSNLVCRLLLEKKKK